MAKQCVYLLYDEWGPFSVYRSGSATEKYNEEIGDSCIEELVVVDAPQLKVQTLQYHAIKSINGHNVAVPEVYPRILKAAITSSSSDERVPLSTRYTHVYVVGYTACEDSCMCYECGASPAAFVSMSMAKIELRRRALACRDCREDENNRLVLRTFEVNKKRKPIETEVVPYNVLTRADIEAIEAQEAVEAQEAQEAADDEESDKDEESESESESESE